MTILVPPPVPTPVDDKASPQTSPISRWRWWVHLLLIGGYIIPRIGLTLAFPRHHPALSNNVATLLLVCAVELIFFALIYGLGCRVSGATAEQVFLPWRPGWLVVPLGLVYSLGIRLAAGVVIFAVFILLVGSKAVPLDSAQHFVQTQQPDVQKLVDVSAMRISPGYFWLTVTLVSIVAAGLREEMWRGATLGAMRALWPRAFGSVRGQIIAVCLIAVVFGAAHLQLGPIGAVVAGLLGLFLGVIIVVHRSIWPAVIAHGLLDATTFALIPFALTKLQQLH
jgi:membrane protease YdiL (CAAX protease family)